MRPAIHWVVRRLRAPFWDFCRRRSPADYSIAAQYLQMSAARRQSEGEQIANQLNAVLNSSAAASVRVGGFTQPEGIPQEGVPLGRQKLGTMSSGDVEADLDLVRVSDPSAGKIWLISSDTLAKVPELYDQVEARQVESKLPSVLVKHQFAGMPLWQWLALLVAVPVAAAIGWLVLVLLEIPIRWWARRRGQVEVANWRSVSAPAWLLTGTVVHQIFARYLGMPLLPRHYYFQFTSIALIIERDLDCVARRAMVAAPRAQSRAGPRARRHRIAHAAGRAHPQGNDFCGRRSGGAGQPGLQHEHRARRPRHWRPGDRLRRAEDHRESFRWRFRARATKCFASAMCAASAIVLASSKISACAPLASAPTNERWWRFPTGPWRTINLENLSRRDKILFKTTLGLRPESKADHVRFVLAEIRRLLYSHPKVETKTVRVRLTDIAGTSLSVEVVAYILTRDFNEFAAVREDVLLRMMDILEDSGGGLALPSQTLYLSRDSGVEKEKADNAAKKIAELRDGKQLPFPDFHEEDISSFKGSIEYPQPESAVRKQQMIPARPARHGITRKRRGLR